jgi:DNA-directed RNA polymerase specialized sigma24 family protein
MTDPTDSLVGWFDALRAGSDDAANELWDRYFPRLVGLARSKLGGLRRKASADEEDVALSAFDSFCRRAKGGGFPRLNDRDDLWRLLSTVTARKAARLVRDQHRLKRGGGHVAGESVFDDTTAPGIGGVAGAALPPAVEAELADDMLRMLDALGDAELRAIALWRMEGFTNAEIAGRLGKAVATVERRLALIRKAWERLDTADAS